MKKPALADVTAWHHSKRQSLQKCLVALSVIALAISNFWNTADADLRSNVQSWTAAFDEVPGDQAYIARVRNIFERLKAAVGPAVLLSELYVLNSDNEPWAIALEDGNVVLSRGALDVVYGASNQSMEAKDAQIAFILGHELNHIAKADFWHEQVYLGFTSTAESAARDVNKQAIARRHETELRADEDGFIYASLAGFNTRHVLTSVDGQESFLHYWVRQTRTERNVANFGADVRARFLLQSLSSLDEAISFYEYGTRLAHFGYLQEARVLLNEFYRIYPSHQVLNNLGSVYLQLARRQMPVEMSSRLWLDIGLRMDSGIPAMSRSLDKDFPIEVDRLLTRSIQLLNSARDIASDDIEITANLASAYILRYQYDLARSVIKPLWEQQQNHPVLQVLLAMAIVEDDRASNQWKNEALKELLSLWNSDQTTIDVLFTTTRLLDKHQHKLPLADRPQVLWQPLAERYNELPAHWQTLACLEFQELPACTHRRSIEKNPEGKPTRVLVSTPFRTGDNTIIKRFSELGALASDPGLKPGDKLSDPAVQRILQQWDSPLGDKLSAIDALIYRHNNGNSLLAIDGQILMITIRDHHFAFKDHLLEVSRSEQLIANLTEVTSGPFSILSDRYSWAARLLQERVEELWLVAARL